jgi:hypothetical protein
LIFFVMGWMFVLGIMVGRGTAPVPLRTYALEKELAALKAGMLQKEREQLDFQAKDSEAQSTELGFYEELKKPPTQTEPRRPSAPSPTTIPAKTSSVNPAAQKPPSGAAATGSAATPPPQSAPRAKCPQGRLNPQRHPHLHRFRRPHLQRHRHPNRHRHRPPRQPNRRRHPNLNRRALFNPLSKRPPPRRCPARCSER